MTDNECDCVPGHRCDCWDYRQKESIEVKAAELYLHYSQPKDVEGTIRLLLDQLELHGEHFDETPRRVAALFQSFRQEHDLKGILKKGFEETKDNLLVVQTNIPFKGLCAHHLLPFFGTAAVGYIPKRRIVGLSKITRLVLA